MSETGVLLPRSDLAAAIARAEAHSPFLRRLIARRPEIVEALARDGLGAAIIYFQRSYEIPQMWSGVLMLGLFGFALSLLFRLFEHWALRWYRGQRQLERQD